MKDPLDQRYDPYQVFNDEAQRQGLPALLFFDTGSMAIRKIFARLREQAQDAARLEEARSILTKVESRLRAEIFFYDVGNAGELDQALAEPTWEWERFLLPEMFQPHGFMQLILGDEEQLLEPIQCEEVHPEPLPQYDLAPSQTWEKTFPL
jgi:hypothetical protein